MALFLLRNSITMGASLMLLLTSFTTSAFVAPVPMAQRLSQLPTKSIIPSPSQTAVNMLPVDSFQSSAFLLSDGLSAATSYNSAVSGSLSTLRTFFIVIGASIFGIAALVLFTSAVVVPKAAEQLERDTKRLRPELWREYEAKLGPGETMVNRPELLQELGNKMQPIITQEYEREAEEKFGPKK